MYIKLENIRIHRGGAAVVLGSLSPRTRNAQVEYYENNKVDFLVATDAIGMGLNLNIDHVCFTSLEKFDGRYLRNLYPDEIGQIAGRAGRYKNDGTFSYTKEAGNLDPLIINAIENHSYNQIQKIYWRNSDINFSSIETVISSLKQFPIQNFLIHKKNAIDELNFRNLIEDNEIKLHLINKKNIKLLWEICRIPDFEKIFNDSYIQFLKNIFLILIQNNNYIPEDWINKKISKLDNFDGGIPELSMKISQIRTWTYISNQHKWLNNPVHWQEITQNIENNLSDNLHISLTNKFVDTTSKYFMNSNDNKIVDKLEINDNNEITLDSKKYGILSGFDLLLNKNLISHSLFSLSHVKKSIRNMIEEKIEDFLNAPNNSINLGEVSKINLKDITLIYWGNEAVGKLIKGSKIYSPTAEALNSEFLSTENKLLVSAKLQNWIDNEILNTLKPIRDKLDDNLDSQLRAIVYNCFENLGTYPIAEFKDFLKSLNEEKRNYLSKLGIRIGAKFFFIPNLMKKKSLELSALLWKVYNSPGIEGHLPLPIDGRVSFTSDLDISKDYWNLIGYICVNKFAFRIDVFEKIFYLARQKIKKGPFLESSDLMNPIGCNSDQLADILSYCDYSFLSLNNEKKLYYAKKLNNNDIKNIKKTPKKTNKKTKKSIKNKIKKQIDPNSPFAVFEKLL